MYDYRSVYWIRIRIGSGLDPDWIQTRFGSRLRLDPDSVWIRIRMNPDSDWIQTRIGSRFGLDLDSDWIRIRMESGFNQVSGSESGFEIRIQEGKKTSKNIRKLRICKYCRSEGRKRCAVSDGRRRSGGCGDGKVHGEPGGPGRGLQVQNYLGFIVRVLL
jgi:hypothetical protein